MRRQRFTDFEDPQGAAPVMIPRIGKIGLGVKRTNANGKEYPSETKYFVVDDPSAHIIANACLEQKRISEAVADEWKKGTRGPASLPVLFTTDDLTMIAPRALEMWGKGVKLCSGDGRRAERLVINKDGTTSLQTVQCPCEHLDSGRCKRQMRLLVMIPNVTTAGCFQIDTTSRASIDGVYQDLEYIENFFGRIHWLLDPETGEPLLTMMREAWTSTTDKKTHYRIRIRPKDLTLDKLVQYRTGGTFAQLAGSRQRLLPDIGNEQPRSQGGDYIDGTPAEPISVDRQTGEILEPSPQAARTRRLIEQQQAAAAEAPDDEPADIPATDSEPKADVPDVDGATGEVLEREPGDDTDAENNPGGALDNGKIF